MLYDARIYLMNYIYHRMSKKVGLSEFTYPDLNLFVESIANKKQASYLLDINNNLKKIIVDISKKELNERNKGLNDLVFVLHYIENRKEVFRCFNDYLYEMINQNECGDLNGVIIQSEYAIDCCLYLVFELVKRKEYDVFSENCLLAVQYLVDAGKKAPLFIGGLRRSFLKGIELLKIYPSLIGLIKYTNTEDSVIFLFLNLLLGFDGDEQKDKMMDIYNYVNIIYGLSQKKIYSVVKDLRRSIPVKNHQENKAVQSSLFDKYILNSSVLGRDVIMVKLLLLHYTYFLCPEVLCKVSKNKDKLGLSVSDVNVLSALSGFDVPYILSLNSALCAEGLRRKIYCPSRYDGVYDYMMASVNAWEGHEINLESENKDKNQKDKLPLVTVIFTVFNPDLDLFEASLKSILSQTYPKLEIIVIDDNSAREIGERLNDMLNKYRNDLACSIIYKRNDENVGQYMSRNIAINISNGDFIAIQDDDDISHPDRIRCQIELMLNDESVLATHTHHIRISENSGVMLDGDSLGEVLGNAPVSFVWRKKVFDEIGLFLPTKTRGDIEYRTRMIRCYPDSAIKKVALPLMIVRGGLETVSSQKEYYYRSALNCFRYMMNQMPVNTCNMISGDRWVPLLLK